MSVANGALKAPAAAAIARNIADRAAGAANTNGGCAASIFLSEVSSRVESSARIGVRKQAAAIAVIQRRRDPPPECPPPKCPPPECPPPPNRPPPEARGAE